jgi:FKBP-type peptidyl-prolyl cis-trans isomerase
MSAPAPDAVHLASGLVYQMLRPGTGEERPGPDDVVRASYEAWTDTGRLLADTGPVTFPVSGLCPGLAEAVQLMSAGARIRVWVPPYLAGSHYGEAAEETRTYEIDLDGFTRTGEPRQIPPELRSPRLD